MKRWIHAATENIDQKIKDYLAAWAHDNVKAGEEACSLKDFRSELKDKGLKYTDSRYDYYLQCYNNMNNAKTGSSTKVNASTDPRDRIPYLEDRIDRLTQYIDECKAEGCDPEEFVDEMAELQELEEQLNFAWQDDEAEYNYAVEQQEFNPDGSLKFYGSTDVKASTAWDEGWSKRLNKETGESYFVYSCPKATAYVFQSNEKDDNGEYNSSAEVGFTEDLFKNKIKKSFFGRGSELDAMTWAEKVIFDEKSINSSSSFDQMRTNAAQARRILKTFDPEKVEYVQKCVDDINDEIAQSFEKEDDDVTLINIQSIKTDWLIGAIEDDLMTEDEFNEIFEWLDAIALEEAHSQA